MRSFHRTGLVLAMLAAFSAAPSHASTFTYRGALSDRGVPAEGEYGFRLSFYAAKAGGLPIAPALALDGVPVRGGAFATELALDPKVEARESLWVEVEVRDAKGNFVPLAERTEVRPKETAAGVCWDTQGNAGTNPTTDFLGTTDAQPLNLRAGNFRVLRLEPAGGIPNVIAGAPDNFVSVVATGATIGGGESQTITDSGGTIAGGKFNDAGDSKGTSVDADYATVGGGFNNQANGQRSTISGGAGNTVLGSHGVVPGGKFNCAGGDYSWAGGLGAKVRPAAVPAAGPCAGLPAGPATTGDIGTFVWNAGDNNVLVSTGPNQFLARAPGGIGFNTNTVADATLSLANVAGVGPTEPLLRIFNGTADQTAGGRLLISENGVSSAGGYLDYDAFGNVFTIGTNTGAADVPTLVMGRGTGRVGIGRTATANTLEVEGNASKTTATAWLANSDARIKQEIEPIPHALDTLLRVHPVTFRYTEAYRAAHPTIVDRHYYNVLAQEFAEVFPEAVQRSGEKLPGGDDEILQVDVHPALITTIAATQELAQQLQALSERIARLEAENAELREIAGQAAR